MLTELRAYLLGAGHGINYQRPINALCDYLAAQQRELAALRERVEKRLSRCLECGGKGWVNAGDDCPSCRPEPTTAGTAEPVRLACGHPRSALVPLGITGPDACGICYSDEGQAELERDAGAEPKPAEAEAKCEKCGGTARSRDFPDYSCPSCKGTGKAPAADASEGQDENPRDASYWHTRCLTAETSLDTVRAALATARAECEELRDRLCELTAERDTDAAKRRELERELDSCILGDELRGAKKRIVELERELTDPQKLHALSHAAHQRELVDLRNSYHESQGWAQTWRIKAEKAEARIADLEASVKTLGAVTSPGWMVVPAEDWNRKMQLEPRLERAERVVAAVRRARAAYLPEDVTRALAEIDAAQPVQRGTT